MTKLFLYTPRRTGWSNGNPVDPAKCAVAVYSRERFGGSYQCNGKAKYDAEIDGQKVKVCGVHNPAAMAKREAEREAKYQAEKRAFEYRYNRPGEYREALEQIAKGHNDPRTLARELLAKWGDL